MCLNNINHKPIEPFLKWAGGKRWLVKKNLRLSPPSFKTYIEPFIGSAAVFFSIPSRPFIISDINPDLINCYRTIRDHPNLLEDLVKFHQSNHSKEYYYHIRSNEPMSDIDKAAQFIYLNRTCFNGLYRVNRQGKFNVPIGTKNKEFDEDYCVISKRLKEGKILNQDFSKTISEAEAGDYIFVDPPYTVNHNLNGFLEYNEKIFSWEDQVRLKKSIIEALDRGVSITMSNADHESIHDLYSGLGNIERIERNSVISGQSFGRKTTSEVIIRFGWNNSN